MNNLNYFNNKGDYSWSKNRTRFQRDGSVKRATIFEPFWMKPISLILIDWENVALFSSILNG
jgi:hypothetical protein